MLSSNRDAMGAVTQFEIVFGGQGGQGIRLMSALLGQACAAAGKHVASSASYGPEVRGSFTRSEVIVSDEMIVYPRVLNPNVLVVLSQEAYDRLRGEAPADGLIVYEAEAITPAPDAICRQWPVSALQIADELGNRGSANMVMLGAAAAITGLANLDDLRKTLPATRRAENETALERGFALAVSCH